MRATMSLGPPAGNGTIIRIGRLGKLALPELSWPWAKIGGKMQSKVESKAATSSGTARIIASSRRLLVGAPAIVTGAMVAGKRFVHVFRAQSKSRFQLKLPHEERSQSAPFETGACKGMRPPQGEVFPSC